MKKESINVFYIIGLFLIFFVLVFFISSSQKNKKNTSKEDFNVVEQISQEDEYKTFREEYLPTYSIMTYTNATLNSLSSEIVNNIRLLQIAMQIAEEKNATQSLVAGEIAYDAAVIHQIILELTGKAVESPLNTDNKYIKYDQAQQKYYYYYNDLKPLKAHITETISAKAENGETTLEYVCYYPTETQIINNDFNGLEKFTNLIVLKENGNYTYCKYAIVSINRQANLDYYYLIKNEEEQYGVMNGNGETILEPIYTNIIIPENSKKLFLCQREKDSPFEIAGDTRYVTALSAYSNLSAIKSTSGADNFWYEKNVLTYIQGDKVGVTDFEGNNIITPEYDAIEGFSYIPERLLLKKDNKYGLADTTGKIISEAIYTKIDVKRENALTLIYGYDNENKQILIEKIQNAEIPKEYYPDEIKEWKVYTKIIYYYK